MRLQKQPNSWSCFPTALAICINKPISEVIKEIGHDGSEQWWPELPEPYCRRSFHSQEIIDVAEVFGYDIVQYESQPLSYPGYNATLLSPYKDPENRFLEIIIQNNGILVGHPLVGSSKDHAVAWNGSMCYDPNGHRYALHYFKIDYFFKVVESKYPKTKPK